MPAADNDIWLLAFFFANALCLVWSFGCGIFRRPLLRWLERHPTLFRIWMLVGCVPWLAVIVTMIVSSPQPVD
jgi:hypothetical protein